MNTTDEQLLDVVIVGAGISGDQRCLLFEKTMS